MYQFEEIQLTAKDAVNAIRREALHTLSSHSFPALYMWKDEMRLSIATEPSFFAVKYGQAGSNAYFFPCGSAEKKRAFLTYLLQHNRSHLSLHYLSAQDQSFLEAEFPGVFQLSEDRDSFEYIFSAAEQASLEGGRFKHIRKEINHIKKKHSLVCEAITADNLSQVRAITLDWNATHISHAGQLAADVEPVLLAIDAFLSLGLEGVLIRDEDDACGYVFGAPLSEDTFDIHASKCRSQEEGLDYFCKQIFYQQIKDQYPYVNREEDLGLPGLRMRKLSLRPLSLTPIWRAEVL